MVSVLAAITICWIGGQPASVAAQQTQCIGCGGGAFSITPDGGTLTVLESSTGNQASFSASNTGSPRNINFACQATGNVTCTGVDYTSYSFDATETIDVTVTYSSGSPGSGTITLVASGDASETGHRNITINALVLPVVTVYTPVVTSGSRAIVRNRRPTIRATIDKGTFPLDTTSYRMVWRTDTVSQWRGDTLTVARWNRGVMEWEVDSALGLNGAGADSALLAVKACDNQSHCTTVTRWAVLPNDSTAVLGWAGVPAGTTTSGFSAPFGPGVSVNGAEIETGFNSIPYFAMGAARSAGLVYSTRQSYPRALVPVHAQLRWPNSGTPDQLIFRLYDGATKLDSLKLTSPTCTTGSALTCRAVLQGDFSGSTFSVPTRKWLKVEVAVTSGGVTRTSADSVEAVLVDRRSTRFGSGWWPSAYYQLIQSGNDRMLISPTGTATIYRGNGDSLYLPPVGSFVGLTKTSSGWELRARGDSAVLRFDSNGRLRASQDRNGNVDSLVHGTGDSLIALRDPTAHTITFGYSSGLLSTITDANSRVTAVAIGGSNQLTYDSLSSVTSAPLVSRYVYQSYSGTNTSVLTKRIGVILDTTVVVYDSTFRRRPVQALLPQVRDPSASLVKPAINYTAVERRGFGAIVRTDSAGAYVEMKDPLNNWTRSWLNRWGQVLLSWDSLGVLGRSRYADDGRVLTTEGKIGGDTTRTYYRYDALQRLAKTYINRVENGKGVLRLDSLVYDGNHRVIKHLDSRGKVDSTTYDGKGNVVSVTDPAGYSTVYWYGTNGLVDSMAPPSSTQLVRYKYDGTWKQRVSTRMGSISSSTIVDSTTYDSYGRASATMQRIPVRIASGVQKFQWRQTVPYYRVTNQLDSSIVARTDDCDYCMTPPSFGTDAAHTIKVGYRFDRAGRDSLRLVSNDTSKATRYLYDGLGRLLTRTPPNAAGTPPRDSLVYDIAGNLLKGYSRRGDSIITAYDSRNRVTTRAVAGVGTYTSVYGGPLDQLTRLYLTSPVDSIGGVNGEVRYGYDRRGRLVADTSYTGSVVRATSHTFDAYERDSITTAPTGVWKIRYDADRGLPSMVVTPFADSMAYSFDGQGRNGARSKYSNGSAHSYTIDYTASGGSALIRDLISGWTPGTYDPEGILDESSQGPALRPTWTEQHGSGQTVDSTADSLQYDGWQRMTSWRQSRKVSGSWSLFASDSVWFDVDGNIYTPGGTESYEAKTSRLLSRSEGGWTWSYSYDAAGNQTQVAGDSASVKQDTWKYGYDGLNRLVSVRRRITGWAADSLIARYGYDVLGRRIVRRVYSPSSPTGTMYLRYSYSGDQVAFETDSAGSTLGWQYTWGTDVDDLVGIHDANGDYAVVQDQLRSVRGVIRRDGTWIMSQRFLPYGRLSKQYKASGVVSTMPYGWTGREYDGETGFYFNRARYYDPGQRRWTQEDPIGYSGGSNLYNYVGGMVQSARDPSGLYTPSPWEMDPTHGGNCMSPDGSIANCGASDPSYGHGGGGLSVFKVRVNGQWMGTTVASGLLGFDQDQIAGMVHQEAVDWAWRVAAGMPGLSPSLAGAAEPEDRSSPGGGEKGLDAPLAAKHEIPFSLEPNLATSKTTVKMYARFTSPLEGEATLLVDLPTMTGFPATLGGKLWYFDGFAKGLGFPNPTPIGGPVYGFLYNWPAGTSVYWGTVWDKYGLKRLPRRF